MTVGLQEVLDDEVYREAGTLRVLEAGCGSGSNVRLPEDRHIVGIDISQEELDKNSIVDEKIVGDLQTYPLPEGAFDLVVCWDVLEHLSDPVSALDQMDRSVNAGGYLLLAFPNVFSIKGLIAKMTPVWFHVMVYKFIYGANYGRPGYITFPTYLRWSIAPDRIEEYARAHDFDIRYELTYESGVQQRFRNKLFLKGVVFDALEGLVKLLSLGKLTIAGSDCAVLLRKK